MVLSSRIGASIRTPDAQMGLRTWLRNRSKRQSAEEAQSELEECLVDAENEDEALVCVDSATAAGAAFAMDFDAEVERNRLRWSRAAATMEATTRNAATMDTAKPPQASMDDIKEEVTTDRVSATTDVSAEGIIVGGGGVLVLVLLSMLRGDGPSLSSPPVADFPDPFLGLYAGAAIGLVPAAILVSIRDWLDSGRKKRM